MNTEIIFASGSKGNTVRANGNGGFLPRGWYVRVTDTENGKQRTIGPCMGKKTAKTVADLCTLEKDGFKWNPEIRELDEIRQNPTVYSGADHDAIAIVSAEDGKDFADYYGEFHNGYPWIHPVLESFADSRGLIWEWIDPGTIGLYL